MTDGDYTDDALRFPEAKRFTRDLALDIVRDHACNLWSPSRDALRCDWMELAGHHAPTLTLLVGRGAMVHGARFVGVDTDPATIDGCRAHFGPDAPAVWVNGTVETVLTRREHADTVARVGVLVYDSHDGVHARPHRVRRTLRPLLDFARRQHDALGEFLLVLNLASDPRFTRPEHHNEYAQVLSEGLGASVSVDDIHRYTSKATQMAWVALRYGF